MVVAIATGDLGESPECRAPGIWGFRKMSQKLQRTENVRGPLGGAEEKGSGRRVIHAVGGRRRRSGEVMD